MKNKKQPLITLLMVIFCTSANYVPARRSPKQDVFSKSHTSTIVGSTIIRENFGSRLTGIADGSCDMAFPVLYR